MITRKNLHTDPKWISMRQNISECSQTGSVVLNHRIRVEGATGTTITEFPVKIPDNWDETINPMIRKVGFTNSTGSNEKYRFEIGYEVIAPGDVIDNIEDDTITWTNDSYDTDDTWLNTDWKELDKSLFIGKTHVIFSVKRIGGDSEDTRGGEFRLYAIDIKYKRKTFDIDLE